MKPPIPSERQEEDAEGCLLQEIEKIGKFSMCTTQVQFEMWGRNSWFVSEMRGQKKQSSPKRHWPNVLKLEYPQEQ